MPSNELFVNLNEAFQDLDYDYRFRVFVYNGDGVDVQYYCIHAVSYDLAKLLLVSCVPDLDGFLYLTDEDIS